MKKGFVFNSGKCVNCSSCVAACLLYNEWDTKPRLIHTYNSEVIPDLPVVNISMACNHCEEAACLKGCPSGAIESLENGVVVIDEDKCFGCKYCIWNCPYEAPKYSSKKSVMEKCNLCYNSAFSPACATSCPTGALTFKELTYNQDNNPVWFPENNLRPAFVLSGPVADKPVLIVPAHDVFENNSKNKTEAIYGHWSLVLFSFGTMLSVSVLIAAFMNGVFPTTLFPVLLTGSAIMSLFHLGKPLRAWRAVTNIVKSPLSREIAFFIFFATLSGSAILLHSPGLLLAAAVCGLILLAGIDLVYIQADHKSLFHSGQVFLSSLLVVSWMTGNLLPFFFIVLLRTGFSSMLILNSGFQQLRFVRIMIMLLALAGLASGYLERNITASLFILAGEFIDRILFYIDFKPASIGLSIRKKIK